MPGLMRGLAVVVMLVGLSPTPTQACYNSTQPAVDGWTWEVQRAEKSLVLGDPVTAARRVLELFPEVADLSRSHERAELLGRARRVLALAIARTGGALDVGENMSWKTDGQRRAALGWAEAALEARLAGDPDDPLRRAELAEVLAWSPAGRARALPLLAELALADLLPEPRSWAVFGWIAAASGMRELGRIAATHCRQLAGDPQVCRRPQLVWPETQV